jgi:hypothetical protein
VHARAMARYSDEYSIAITYDLVEDEKGDITVDEATEIFENIRVALINTKERRGETTP